LLAALTQAPGCPVGWMIRYTNKELENFVRNVHTGKPIYSKWDTELISWLFLATETFPDGHEKSDVIREQHAKFWHECARDFLDADRKKEYNSIKHGLRAEAGGFSISFGPETEPNEPALPENMISLGGSNFGSRFFDFENLVDKYNFRIKSRSLNWSPESLSKSLELLAFSINNVKNRLLHFNGSDIENLKFYFPTNLDAFEDARKHEIGIGAFEVNAVIRPEGIKPLSKEAILSTYTSGDQKK
jgi:hypothetical protein